MGDNKRRLKVMKKGQGRRGVRQVSY